MVQILLLEGRGGQVVPAPVVENRVLPLPYSPARWNKAEAK